MRFDLKMTSKFSFTPLFICYYLLQGGYVQAGVFDLFLFPYGKIKEIMKFNAILKEMLIIRQ